MASVCCDLLSQRQMVGEGERAGVERGKPPIRIMTKVSHYRVLDFRL